MMARDRQADGTFFYAVTSTGVFCRPSCPSRRPRRDRVRFFATAGAAEQAGFRACRRCHPTAAAQLSGVADAVRRTARYLAAHADEVVSLERLAGIARLSPSHLQRQFKRALGVSPREYQAACRADRFRHELRQGRDVTSALYEAGYGSPSRVYEGVPTGRGMTPAVYRRRGSGVEIGYTIVRSAMGRLLVAGTATGVCAVKLGDSDAVLETDLRGEFPAASLARDRIVSTEWVSAIVDAAPRVARRDRSPARRPRHGVSVARLARAAGDPVGRDALLFGCRPRHRAPSGGARRCTCLRNESRRLVVPCHRVVAKSGESGGYRWGPARKRRLLALEAEVGTGPNHGHTRKAK